MAVVVVLLVVEKGEEESLGIKERGATSMIYIRAESVRRRAPLFSLGFPYHMRLGLPSLPPGSTLFYSLVCVCSGRWGHVHGDMLLPLVGDQVSRRRDYGGTIDKLRTAQRTIERNMLNLKLQDKIPCSEIKKRTKVIDIVEYFLKQKWRWAGHIARMKDNRWTKRCTELQPRRGKRSRG